MNTQTQELRLDGAEPESRAVSPELQRLATLSPRPTALEQTGLSLTFLADLLAKHLATSGVLTGSQLIERLALAGPIVDQVLNYLRTEGRVEVRSRLGLNSELRYGLTDKGRLEANDAIGREWLRRACSRAARRLRGAGPKAVGPPAEGHTAGCP